MKPLCAKCNKPVDEFYFAYSDCSFEVKYTAICHGEIDTMTLDGETQYMLRLGGDKILDFVAFRGKAKEIENHER